MRISRKLKGQLYQAWVKFKMDRTFHVRSALYKAWSYIILSIWLTYKEEAHIVHRPNSGLRNETPYDIQHRVRDDDWTYISFETVDSTVFEYRNNEPPLSSLNTQNFERRYVCSFVISNHEDAHTHTWLNNISSLWYANQDTSQNILTMPRSVFMQTNNRHIIFSPATWELQAAAVDHRSAYWLHLWIKFWEPLLMLAYFS